MKPNQFLADLSSGMVDFGGFSVTYEAIFKY